MLDPPGLADQVGAHVGTREVVGRMMRALPHQQRTGGVRDHLTRQHPANTLRAPLNVHRSARSAIASVHSSKSVWRRLLLRDGRIRAEDQTEDPNPEFVAVVENCGAVHEAAVDVSAVE